MDEAVTELDEEGRFNYGQKIMLFLRMRLLNMDIRISYMEAFI